MIHALVHLLHTLVEGRAFAEELVHEVSKAGKGVSRSHSLRALRLLLGILLLGLRLRHWLRLLLNFVFLVADWSSLCISSSRSVIDVHTIKRPTKLVRSHVGVSEIFSFYCHFGWLIRLLFQFINLARP